MTPNPYPRLYTGLCDTRPINSESLNTHIKYVTRFMDIMNLPFIPDADVMYFFEYQLDHSVEYWETCHDYTEFCKKFQEGVHGYITALKEGIEIHGENFSISLLGNPQFCSYCEKIPVIRDFDILFGQQLRELYPLTFLSPRVATVSENKLAELAMQ